jgi:hypothetical protein
MSKSEVWYDSCRLLLVNFVVKKYLLGTSRDKSHASRYYQLKCRHVPTAPYLKRFGRRDDDLCWWCGKAAQTREHLFCHCRMEERAAGAVEGSRARNQLESEKVQARANIGAVFARDV